MEDPSFDAHSDANNTYMYWDTFIASIKSVGTACTLAAVGFYMHQRGFISTSGKKMLALISQQVTFPLFLFTKIISCPHNGHVCPNVYESLQQVWYLALWPLFVVGMGLLVGRCVAIITNTPIQQYRSVMAAVGFGNSTGLPITLLTVVHSNFSKQTELGRVDPTLFLSVYLLLYPVLQWGLGGWLLAPANNNNHDTDNKNNDKQPPTSNVNNKKNHASSNDKTSTFLTSSVPLNDTTSSNTTAPLSLSTTPLYNVHNNHNNTSSSLYTNVLNNTSVDNYYRRHRQGLYSSDEGLYLSDFNLQALARNNSSFYSATTPPISNPVTMAALEDQPRYVTRTNTTNNNNNTTPEDDNDDDSSQPEFLLYDTVTAAAEESHTTHPSTPTDSIESPPPSMEDPEKLSLLDTTTTTTPLLSLDTQQQQQHEQQPLLLSSIHESNETTPTNNHNDDSYGATTNHHNNNSNKKTASVPLQQPESLPMTPLRKTMSFLNLSFVENKYMDNFSATLHNIGQRCFQPPVMGAILGILVAISPLRRVFVDLTANGTDIAPMEWLFDGLYSVGLTAVPINMMILGCNLSNSYNQYQASRRLPTTTSSTRSSSSSSSQTLSLRTMTGIVVGKMMVMPAIGFAAAWTLQTYVLHIPDAIDAAFYLVLLIVFLTPTANNVMVMVELSGSNTKEGIANVIALQYAVAPVILSATMTVAIGYAQRL